MNDHEQRYPGADVRRVEIDGGDGDLSVRWSAREDVLVGGDETGVEVELDGDTLSVTRASTRGLLGIFSNPSLRVELPDTVREARVRVRSGDVVLEQARGGIEARVDHGDLRVRGGRGELAVKLGAGDVSVDAYSGPIAVASGAGDVGLTGVDGPLAIQSGAGDVTLRGGHGDVAIKSGRGDMVMRDRGGEHAEVKTGAGDVSITGGAIGSVAIQTGMGDVSCATVLGADDHEFTTGAGDITVAVPRGLSARIEATTVSGSIDSDIPLVAVGKRGPKSVLGRRLVGGIGDGAQRAEIRIRSVRGDVRLKWLDGAAAGRTASSTAWSDSPEDTDVDVEVDVDMDTKMDVETGDASETVAPKSEPAPSGAGEERAILSALAAGTISVAEAERLLDALARRGGTEAGAS
ncbi:MAG TPA: DUF4097 family beta strand repeat-containing protein [Thermomicrobiaceae bacterium]|nr:DUF4097 family beta strand repeat-containing protein [Thermomicrobiaceae bacterium]